MFPFHLPFWSFLFSLHVNFAAALCFQFLAAALCFQFLGALWFPVEDAFVAFGAGLEVGRGFVVLFVATFPSPLKT